MRMTRWPSAVRWASLVRSCSNAGGGEVGRGAVGLDDEVVVGPVEVDLVAGDGRVDLEPLQLVPGHQRQESFFEFAARDLGPAFQGRQRFEQGSGTAAG
jgi:hypothetical protein